MKIIFSGGGTLGAVMPILVVARELQKKYSAKIIWVGTKQGPEKKLIEENGIKFIMIPSGKFRRYFSLANFFDIFKISLAFYKSFLLLIKEKPDFLVSTGGYVSVPLHLAAALLRIPTWIHQQDLKAGLSNKIMAKTASKITVSLQNSALYFNSNKTEWTGNFCRFFDVDKNKSKKIFSIDDSEPVILAVGGSTGAAKINDMILESLKHLPDSWHIIHIVGTERSAQRCFDESKKRPNYKVYKFLYDQMPYALFLADIVITRAGFSTLTELSFLKKPSIIIPISDSHQESNAEIFKNNNSAIVMDERVAHGNDLAESILMLINNLDESKKMGERMKATLPIADEEKIISITEQLIKK